MGDAIVTTCFRAASRSPLGRGFTATARQQAAVALENSGQGWWDWDLRSGTALLDDTWHRLMGWAPGEIAEPIAAWTNSIHPDDAPSVHAALTRHLASDDARYDVDYRARRKDGTWVWMNTRGRVQARDEDRQAIRMIGTLQDISQRRAHGTGDRGFASSRKRFYCARFTIE